MTKEDEARLAMARRIHLSHTSCDGDCDVSFLLRLLDEQAARVATLTAAGNEVVAVWGKQSGRIWENMGSDNPRVESVEASIEALEAAIRARAETPKEEV